jgi:23S rRNA (cytosine1962-C5)-methyltransferase
MPDTETRVRLKPAEDERIRDGHLWVYDNEIAAVEGSPADGSVVWVEDHRGRKLGTGFIDLGSVIRVRLLTRGAGRKFGPVDVDSLLARALGRREFFDVEAVRLVNSEGDLMPGLVMDRYGATTVIQPRTPGWMAGEMLSAIVETTRRVIAPAVVLVRDEGGLRKVEGAPPALIAVGEEDRDARTVIYDGRLEMEVDFFGGHKTGYYIDQRENRRSVLFQVYGKRVLDCFCYTGAWSLACAAGPIGRGSGAAEVTGVDSSAAALVLARANAERNGLGDIAAFVEADVFDYLAGAAASREKYDVVILDPPSLARTRRQVAGAMRGYIHLNKLAMGLLNPGGILVTCSCSHHMTRERFMEMLRHTSTLVRRQVAVLRIGGQPEDHPALLGLPETDYLKCVTLRVE